MTLTFQSAEGGYVRKGPFPQLRLEGECLRAADGARLADHRSHHWVVDGKNFIRLDIDVPVRVRADHVSASGHFSCIDGIAYLNGKTYAFADRTRSDWYVVAEERHYAVLTLEET